MDEVDLDDPLSDPSMDQLSEFAARHGLNTAEQAAASARARAAAANYVPVTPHVLEEVLRDLSDKCRALDGGWGRWLHPGAQWDAAKYRVMADVEAARTSVAEACRGRGA